MKQQIITLILIVGLNAPVFFELYKHTLKSKAVWIRVIVGLLFWLTALQTQMVAALVGILYLYFTRYRYITSEDDLRTRPLWHMKLRDFVAASIITCIARVGIFLIHLVYILVMLKLVKYNLKPQDIITYYSEAQTGFKVLLAIEIVLIAPIVEEYVFRYFLYDKMFVPRMPLAVAALLSTALFTVLHFNISGIPTFFGLGLLCTYLYEKKGYWAAVTAHGISNLLTLLLI